LAHAKLQVREVIAAARIGLKPFGIVGFDRKQGFRDRHAGERFLDCAGDVAAAREQPAD
jgi:hypothetical protein